MNRFWQLVPWVYFFICLSILSLFFFRHFTGVQGDGIYYYSYTASILWDGDLDFKNQFDHPQKGDPSGTQTITGGNYFIDQTTGKAFSFFSPGTGLLMLPLTAIGRLATSLPFYPTTQSFLNSVSPSCPPSSTGHSILSEARPDDSFSPFFLRLAGYTSVILTSLAVLLIFLILRRYLSSIVSALIPLVFLFGTNWLFYTVSFSMWSHAAAAGLFGLIGGFFFSTRNFSLIFFALFSLFFLYITAKETSRIISPSYIKHFILIALFFLIGASPQLASNFILHGNPFVTPFQAVQNCIRPLGSVGTHSFSPFNPRNLYLVYSTLFNSSNGLFYFHPLYLLGLIGLLVVRFRESTFQALVNLCAVGIYLFWLIDATYFDTWFHRAAGSGFGHRRFIDLLPVFIFGAAALVAHLRKKKLGGFLGALILSLLLTSGLLLFYLFTQNTSLFFQLHDSFSRLYGHLLQKSLFWILTALFFLLIFFVLNKEKKKEKACPRPLAAMLVGIILIIFPAFLFRGDPNWQRERLQQKQGFFLMYSMDAYVKLPTTYWGLPQQGARPTLSFPARIILPAPLQKGDIVLFKITIEEPHTNNQRANMSSNKEERLLFLSLSVGQQFVGRRRLRPGRQILEFELKQNIPGSNANELVLELKPRAETPSRVLFHEGRIIFKEFDAPPFGYVDLPAQDKAILDEERLFLAGWVLDDRRVAEVVVARDLLPEEDEDSTSCISFGDEKLVMLGQAVFEESTRPDVEKVFVLYPGILHAGWKFELHRSLLPQCQYTSYTIHVIARDINGNKSELSCKKIICLPSSLRFP